MMAQCIGCGREIPAWKMRWGKQDGTLNRMRSQYTRIYECCHCGARYSVEVRSQVEGIVAVLAGSLLGGWMVISLGVRHHALLGLAIAVLVGGGYLLWWRHAARLREPYP
jgi:hypothetical protein